MIALDMVEPKASFLFLFSLFRFRVFNITFPDIIYTHSSNNGRDEFVDEGKKYLLEFPISFFLMNSTR